MKSPFLKIYKAQKNSIMSIMQRITGVLLAVILYCSIVFVKWSHLLTDYTYYSIVSSLYNNSIIFDIIFGIVEISILYHLVMGFRYYFYVHGKDFSAISFYIGYFLFSLLILVKGVFAANNLGSCTSMDIDTLIWFLIS